MRWNEFFNYELETFEKSDYYLAQIACVIAQSNAAKGKAFKINDFLIKFKLGAEKVIKLSGEQMKSLFQGITGNK